jgi:mono/diheme cytochrome c family protein
MKRVIPLLTLLVVLAGGGCTAIAWHPKIDPVAQPDADAKLIPRGAELAALGDCATCHTRPHGEPYAGGLRLATPFGAIYSTNITPDPDTGIGRWSRAAFIRAMRQGVDRTGNNLYPAFPYDHFTHVTDDDLAAVYAFLMAEQPVRATPPANELAFPLNWRPLLAGWNLLFLHDRRFQPDPAHDARWNRGAYLVEGLGHCASCHSPRNAFGAEVQDESLAGGTAEGWTAPPLAGAPWTEASLFSYLRTGLDAHHGAAAGPMAPVTWSLARVPDEDVRAMAAYLATKTGPVGTPPSESASAMADAPGAAIFAGACASCHGPSSPMTSNGAPSLALSSAVQSNSPDNALRIILGGIPPEPYRAGPQMPGFAPMLRDSQLADLASYLRGRFAPGDPAWTGLPDAIHRIRTERSMP